jgi:hypothetical protein
LHAIGRALTLRILAADNMETPARIARTLLCPNMKRLWLCVACSLVLTSCVPVDDFGTYWNKGFVDPALEGSWKRIGHPGENRDTIPGPDEWRFTKNGASYSLQAINAIDPALEPDVAAQMKRDSQDVLSARTLRVGRQLLLMQRDAIAPGDGILTRYEVRGRTLNAYALDNDAAVDFLEKKHPHATHIQENTGEGRYVVISTFDDEVFRILSEFVDDPAYWILTCQYTKTSK